MSDDPQRHLRAWLPHLAMVALLGLALWLVVAVFAPVRDPLLLSAALAGLSYPVLFRPVLAMVRRLLPHLAESWQRRIAAVSSTVALVCALLAPLVLLLVASLRSLTEAGRVILGLVLHREDQIKATVALLRAKSAELVQRYPALPLDPSDVEGFFNSLLSQSQGQAMLSFVFKGTGGFLAETVLALILLSWFYDQGPVLVRKLLTYTPLDGAQRVALCRRFEAAVLRLLCDTIAQALVRGAALGILAWLIGGFNPIQITLVGTFVSLIPVVGLIFVWLPLASLLWSSGHPALAVTLGLAALIVDLTIQQLAARLAHRLDDRGAWFGFMLFLSLIGGLLAFGSKGLLIGPIAVVVVMVLGDFWLPLYGIGKTMAEDGLPATADPGAELPTAVQVPHQGAIVPPDPQSKV